MQKTVTNSAVSRMNSLLENGVVFHLTVTDAANPDREMNTPSRDQNSTVQAANSFNNRNTDAPQQPTTVPEIVSQPVKQQEKQLDLLSLAAGLYAGGACGGGALCSVPQASPLRPTGVTGA